MTIAAELLRGNYVTWIVAGIVLLLLAFVSVTRDHDEAEATP